MKLIFETDRQIFYSSSSHIALYSSALNHLCRRGISLELRHFVRLVRSCATPIASGI